MPPDPVGHQQGHGPRRARRHNGGVCIRHPARPGDRRAEVLPFRVHRRPLPRRDGRPLGLPRRRGPDGGGVPPGPAAPRRPPGHLPGQRRRLRRRVAAARLRRPGHQAHPLPAREARGQGQDRAFLPDGAGPVPGRGRRRGADRGPGGDEPAVPGLDRDRPTTRRSTPRPARRRSPAGRGPRRPSGPSRTRACCGRRSCGPSGARPTRRPWSACTATSTRSTRGWPGGTSSCVFDPFDLDRIEVRLGGQARRDRRPVRRSDGTATPRPAPRTGRPRTEPAPTGIDYLAALGDGHDAALREQVSYRSLIGGPQEPGKQEEPEEEERRKAVS